MYNLIATDLDGTLLLEDDSIGEYSRAVLAQLVESGRQLVIATGRSQADVEGLLRDVDLPVHLITANGARIRSACGGLEVAEHLDEEVVRTVLQATRDDSELIINLYGQSRWIANANLRLFPDYNGEGEFQPQVVEVEQFPTRGVEKLFFVHKRRDHQALLALDARLAALTGERVHRTFSSPWYLELMNRNVSKGSALEKLGEFLGIPLAQCIAFGDGMNDVEMLNAVGKGLVMGTAHHEVFSALPGHERIGACSEEAVAHYLAATLLR